MKARSLLLGMLLLALCLPMAFAAEDAPFQTGDQVVIWLPEKGKALSSQRSNNYSAAVSVALTEGVLSGYGDTEVWTVEQTEEGWRFFQDGQALSLSGTQNELRLDGELDNWLLEPDGGQFQVKNAGRAVYIRYHLTRKYWLAEKSGTKVAFYVLPRAEEPTQPPEPTEPAPPPEYGGKYLYFGQLHAHTDLSDGTGTVEEAFHYAAQVPGLDFFAVTDHSQNFDGGEGASLTTDASGYSAAWARGKAAAASVTDETFVGLFGFEMTWNQGQGHISTFATPGFLSREQEGYQSYAGGMEQYYEALLEAETSISQFNHPGSAFGDFKTFSAHSPKLDRRITLIEVGEDPGQYDLALGSGWHLAPTINQNNHAGAWGDASDVRTVVLASALTEQAIYDALANYRVYATQDGDLQIYYTLNDREMGSEILRSTIGETVTLRAELCDPTDEGLGKVEVVTEGGLVLTETTLAGSAGTVAFTLPADRDYYYLRITQPDGDWAVTAPVWLDDQDDYGIAGIETATEVTTAGEPQRILLKLYNREGSPLTISSVSFTAEGNHRTDDAVREVEAFGEGVWAFDHTFARDGVYMVTAVVTAQFQGREQRFTMSQPITVMPPALVDQTLVDGTHGNLESLEKAMALAKEQDVSLVVEPAAVTAEALENCRCLIIPAPQMPFEEEFTRLVADFAAGGGTVILCGTSAGENPEAAERLTGLLEAMGSTMHLQADEVRDDVHNGGTSNLIYTMNFGESPWLAGIGEGQRYHQNSGCAVSGGIPLVRGQSSAYSTAGADPVLLAAEEMPSGGWVFVSGGLFFADDYIQDAADVWALPTANQTILENILRISHSPQAMIPIQQLREAEVGRIYLTEGRVTAGTANPHTTFENTIYIQDATGGIAAAPYSAHGLALGTRVRILGALGTDGENPRLEILRLEILEQEDVLAPETVSCDLPREGGQLLQIQGRVVSRDLMADGIGVSRFVLEEETGNRATVLVEANIHSGSRGKNELSRQVVPGNWVSAVGILHVSEGKPVLRLRDCDEVRLLYNPNWTQPDTGDDGEDDPSDEENTGPDATNPDTADPDSTHPDGTDPDTTHPEDGDTDTPGSDGGDNDNPNTGQQEGILFYGSWMLLSALAMGIFHKKKRPG